MSINSIVTGPTLGFFTLGMLCQWLRIMLYSMSNPTDQFTVHFKVLDKKSLCRNLTVCLLYLNSPQRPSSRSRHSQPPLPLKYY